MQPCCSITYVIHIIVFGYFIAGTGNGISFVSGQVETVGNQLENWSLRHPKGAEKVAVTPEGIPYPSLTATLTVGNFGLPLLADVNFAQHQAHFDRERIPERVIHAKGTGAHGYFETTHDITKYTRAAPFASVGKKTRIFTRFSGLIGEQDSADTIRSPKGMSVKFYTEEGNWDLMMSNIPVFPVRDPIVFPSYIRAMRRRPDSHLVDLTAAFDFFTLRPETLHALMYLSSDTGAPKNYRFADYHAVNAFKLVNAQKEVVFCKFHLVSEQGLQNLTREEEVDLAGSNPDVQVQDLYDAIGRKEFPSWTLSIQLMTSAQAIAFRWNPFDATKIWTEDEFPLLPVGRVVLDRSPKNHFADVEQVAFSAGILIQGIEPSTDPVLQGRLFSYPDAQSYRLGVNYAQFPINRPKIPTPVSTYERDGLCTVEDGYDGPNYFPNSFNGPSVDPNAKETPYFVAGFVDRVDTENEDNFSQPKLLWNGFSSGEKTRIVRNSAFFLLQVAVDVRERVYLLLGQVDAEFSSRVRVTVQQLLAVVPN